MNAFTASLPALRLQFEHLASSWRNFIDGWRSLLQLATPAPEPRKPSHRLQPLQTEFVDSTPGLEVTCLDGCLMLTYEGQQRDIILVRGESHSCDSRGRLAVHAFVATDVLIH